MSGVGLVLEQRSMAFRRERVVPVVLAGAVPLAALVPSAPNAAVGDVGAVGPAKPTWEVSVVGNRAALVAETGMMLIPGALMPPCRRPRPG